MGGMCSKVEKAGTAKFNRQSLAGVKRSAEKTALWDGSEFEARGYVKVDPLGPDDKVYSVARSDESAGDLLHLYVLREIPKSSMPIAEDEVADHLCKLSNIDHLHICRFVEAFDFGDTLHLIYERASERSIFEEDVALSRGEPLDEEVAKVFCRQIVMALSVSHKQGIVHGRLNDRSLLADIVEVENGDPRSIKICDMGQTWAMRQARKGLRLEYEAPENLWDELSPIRQGKQDTKAFMRCDMWSVGVIAYRMLSGKLPFVEKVDINISDAIKSSAIYFGPEWDSMPDAKEVVQQLLKKNGRIRPTADRVLRLPWLAIAREPVSKGKMMRVLRNVMQNCTENTFKKFALRVMAEDLDENKLDVVEKAFRFIDKNGDGTLEVEEIRAALRKYYKEEEEAHEAADTIFDAIDRDLSGTLNFAEFTAVSIGPQEYTDKVTLWECFNRFDKDGNGEFSQEEIADVVRKVDYLIEGSLIDEVVEGIAHDIQMPVDFDTFVQIMVTPAGQSLDSMSVSWNRICNQVFKIDAHGVRHLKPKVREEQEVSPLMRNVYRGNSVKFVKDGGARSRSKDSLRKT